MMTHFGIFVPDSPDMHVDCLRAFAAGLEARRIPYQVFPIDHGYQPCDIVVTFGIAKQRTLRGRALEAILLAHRARGLERRNIVIERGFVQRDRYWMVGWGGLNGRADYCNQNSPPDRWQQLGESVFPWRSTGEHIVVCGQVPWDASVQHTDHVQWCRDSVLRLTSLTERPIVFRPHPLQPESVDMSGLSVRVSTATLQEDLVNAWAVVTFNSNAGVEATLAGVPAFVADEGAMGYSLLNKDLNHIESPNMPDRRQWLSDLAYTQWTLQEVARGLAMQHLWENQQPWLARISLAMRRAGRLGKRAA